MHAVAQVRRRTVIRYLVVDTRAQVEQLAMSRRTRIALDEVLKRFPTWDVDWDNAVRAQTSTVRGWQRLPVVISA